MEATLAHFQTDLGSISSEIRALQAESQSMNAKLRDRRALKVKPGLLGRAGRRVMAQLHESPRHCSFCSAPVLSAGRLHAPPPWPTSAHLQESLEDFVGRVSLTPDLIHGIVQSDVQSEEFLSALQTLGRKLASAARDPDLQGTVALR